MKKYSFKKIDAFTTGVSGGNPAGGIYLDKGTNFPSERDMLRIAQELKGFVNEVIFIKPLEEGDISFSLLYYSNECEVDFCGHGTIAVMYDLIKNDDFIKEKEINIKIKGSILTVYNEINENDAIYISAPSPKYFDRKFVKEEIIHALNLEIGDYNSRYNTELVNAGLNTLIVPLVSFDSVVNVKPDFETLLSYCVNNDIDIVIIYSTDVNNKNNSYRTRVFAPKFGYLEDPATGSGNSALGYYLLKHKIWDGEEITIEQGTSLLNPNLIKLNTINEKVLFGGSAVIRIEGDYLLQDS